MYSVSNPDKVGFSKGSRMSIGAVGAAKGSLVPVGLLGADITIGIEKTFRTKNDMFPEVEVASAVQSLTLSVNVILREWTKQNLMYALDVASGDVTDVPASVINVVDEPYKMPASGQLSVTIPRTGLSNIVVKEGGTTLSLNTDYLVIVTPTSTIILAASGGGISAEDDLKISYDYTPLAHTVMPMGHSGARNYYQVLLEEENTLSGTAKTEYLIHRAAIGLDGSFNLNSAENGIDLPLVIQGSLAMGQTVLGTLTNYE